MYAATIATAGLLVGIVAGVTITVLIFAITTGVTALAHRRSTAPDALTTTRVSQSRRHRPVSAH